MERGRGGSNQAPIPKAASFPPSWGSQRRGRRCAPPGPRFGRVHRRDGAGTRLTGARALLHAREEGAPPRGPTPNSRKWVPTHTLLTTSQKRERAPRKADSPARAGRRRGGNGAGQAGRRAREEAAGGTGEMGDREGGGGGWDDGDGAGVWGRSPGPLRARGMAGAASLSNGVYLCVCARGRGRVRACARACVRVRACVHGCA